eukprot:CAMPEP_0204317128 /NCGR_PEP_ID=MMETSP0469-20131031/5791_1 /ASSEMBLY_ACC=CAM_ASM_000384 /TAXON_ID=2969 /ORGANISM="Oxyrrhis marina" /LENGTH=77 /DNA_ID=CAMNT_0051298003 /DNA_START=28 /DNA_END=258 /DNA_ORIENTATION=-
MTLHLNGACRGIMERTTSTGSEATVCSTSSVEMESHESCFGVSKEEAYEAKKKRTMRRLRGAALAFAPARPSKDLMW